MSDNLQKYIGNVGTFGGAKLNKPSNTPSYLSGRQTRYFDKETAANVQEMAKYAPNYYLAQSQGIDYENFYAYTPTYIRLSDVVTTTALTNSIEDFKQVLFADSSIDYIGMGAKIETAGNIYLVISPSNTSSVNATALVRRCNTVYRFLDYYGNILSEPMCWSSSKGALATAPEHQELMVLINSYQHSTIQANENTLSRIKENARILLGSQVYRVRGVVNFIQEFINDEDSTHIIHFDLEADEPSDYDDMENKVAGGLALHWQLLVDGAPQMTVGATQTLTATSSRNGQPPDTVAHPVSYLWTSSNESVATVSDTGVVTALSPGDCTITCVLEQNADITTSYALAVAEQPTDSYVAWLTAIPQTLQQYATAAITAAYFDDGQQTANAIEFSFAGADTDCYSATVSDNTVTINCYYPTDTPLRISATYGTATTFAEIRLTAY